MTEGHAVVDIVVKVQVYAGEPDRDYALRENRNVELSLRETFPTSAGVPASLDRLKALVLDAIERKEAV